jgi:putative transposase
MKNIKPFVRRDISQLQPNDVWTADGHTFDAEVQHPMHGRPFRPEITAIIDVATRRIIGWSVGLAESVWRCWMPSPMQ